MDLLINDQLSRYVGQIGLVPMLLVMYLLTMALFWYEANAAHKNSNSVFDEWFFSSIVMFIWGRVTYMILEWDQFIGGFWFLAPYERYADEIFWFRAMPWKVFRIWDGGFLFLAMYAAFLLANFFYAVYIKKWRWRDMMVPVLISANFLLGGTFYLFGLARLNQEVAAFGIFILGAAVIFALMVYALRLIYSSNPVNQARMIRVATTIYSVIHLYLFSSIFIPQTDLGVVDRIHIYFGVVFLGFLLLVFLWDVRRGEIEVIDDEDAKTAINLNQAIKVKQSR